MNIRDLKYLIAVAQTRHFGKASSQCYVSQPTLSMQLKKLETELGVCIFERDNKSVLITDVGEKLVQQAQVVLQEINKLSQIADNAKNPFAGEFRLGIISTMAPYYLPLLLPILKKKLPKIELIVFENKTEIILSQLRLGLLDAIILAVPVADEGLTSQLLFEEPFVLALPKQHTLRKKNKINLQDIANEKLLLLEEGHCLRDQALEVCRMKDIQTRLEFSATSLETLRHLVGSGAGITLLPKMAIQQKYPNVLIKAFHEPAPSRHVAMLWRENFARSSCCEKLVSLFKNALMDALSRF